MSSGPAARLAAGERLRALFVKMPAPAEVELAGHCGFDAVILDTEHGIASASDLEHHLRAADAAGVPALVRVPSESAILAALDGGARGVVVPHVSSAEAARAVVVAARYPPRGARGLALTTRAGRYATTSVADHLARADSETLVVVQIEDALGVAHAREILAVDGVDAVLIGATDLSISLGHPGEPGHPEVVAAIEQILAAARSAGVHAATVVGDPADVAGWEDRGIALSVFVDTQLMRAAFARAAGFPGAPSAPPGRAAPLVLVPGMAATAAVWEPVLARLGFPHDARIARIDLDETVSGMAESLLATAPERFALAGHSLGGIVALEVVRRAPRRVARLALLDTSARPPTDAQLAAWEALRERIAGGEFERVVSELAELNGPPAEPLREMARSVGPGGLDRELRAQASRTDLRPGLAAIACPTFVVGGRDDAVCPPALQDELAAGIPGARLVRIDGDGHTSPLRAPDAVAAALAEWLA